MKAEREKVETIAGVKQHDWQAPSGLSHSSGSGPGKPGMGCLIFLGFLAGLCSQT
jgi:hypothetical protein